MDTNGEVTDTPQEEKPAGTPSSSPEIRDSPHTHINGPANMVIFVI